MSEPIFLRGGLQKLRTPVRTVRAFFDPNLCPFCNMPIAITRYYCEDCGSLLPRTESCPEPDNIDRMYVYTEYSGRVRGAILRMKRGAYRHTAEAFGLLLTERVGGDIADFDFITYIPTHAKRGFFLRGEHSRNIAAEISARAGVPIRRTLKMTRLAPQQKSLTREQRFENARDLFKAVNAEDIRGKNILLVDDLVTTGATLASAAETLRSAGAAGVSAAAFAKAVLK